MLKYIYKGLLTIVFTCLTIVCFAQQFQVKSFEGLRPLSYASVLNITKGKLYFTDEQGAVSVNLEIGDSLYITYVGYKILRTKVVQLSQTFLLQQEDAILEPVQVVTCKDGIKHEHSNLIAGTAELNFGGVCCWTNGATNARVAVMLKPGFDEVRLNAFSIWLKKALSAPKQSVQAPILFSFYSINEASMLPGELLLNQQIIYYPKKEGKQMVRVDSLQIKIEKPGMYVGIEFVYNEKYEWPIRYIDTAKGIDSVVVQFGAQIDGVYSKDFTLALYDYKKNNWSFAGRKNKSTISEVHGTIKFAAELTSCKK
jgi:hypothetical protein